MRIRLLCCTLLLAFATVSAHDFTAVVDNQTLYFDVLNEVAKTVQLTYRGSIAENRPADVKGVITIPEKVEYGNVAYTISAIGPKAFSHAEDLKGVVLPQGIDSIGDFAFEDCYKLETIVFPDKKIKIGQGIFFRCVSIKDVTLGRGWSSIDLAMFRWSDSLKSISIPLGIEKIQNMKKLKRLTEVNVDADNTHFTSHEGVLYNYDGSVLYGVPRGKAGKLKVKEGTVTITTGAIRDCLEITSVDLPTTATKMSMRELSELTHLGTLILRAESPMTTGRLQDKELLVLQIANTKVQIIVPNNSKKSYQKALAVEKGEYAAEGNAGSLVYSISSEQLPTTKNIKGVKSFTKYE